MAETRSGSGIKKCPICGKPAQEKHRPFCSARCATIDLARWLGGNYRVPGDKISDDEEERRSPEQDDTEEE